MPPSSWDAVSAALFLGFTGDNLTARAGCEVTDVLVEGCAGCGSPSIGACVSSSGTDVDLSLDDVVSI